MNETSGSLTSVSKAVSVLRALMENDGMRVSEVASEMDMPMSTAHSHLSTLVDQELAAKKGDLYVPGSACLEFGEYVRYRQEAFRIAESYTEQLLEESGYRSVFMIEEHGRGVYLHTASGDHPNWKHDRAGNREPLHTVAAGKAILSVLPDERVDEIIERHELVERTENTITDRDELEAELDSIRERGYALNDEENIEGIRAVGAPVTGPDGRVIGSFGVAGAANRLMGDELRERIPRILLALINEYQLEISIGD
jgi:DNA-binding IclR family transcriptional regulator